MTKKKYVMLLCILIAGLITLSFLALVVGSSGASIPHGAVFTYRLNRLALAAITGSALATSGASLQALFRNPLADPHLFGISGGAALGACVAIAFFSSHTMILPTLGAIIGGFISFFVIFFYLRTSKSNALGNYLLIGVLLNSLTAAFITLLKVILPAHKTQSMLFWLVGNISAIDPVYFFIIAPVWLVGMASLWSIKGKLEILSFGLDESQALGINTKAIIQQSIAANCMLIGMTTAFVGLIGFLGLVIPHCMRMLFHANLRFSLPLSAIGGALVMVLFDSLSRLSFFFFQSEIPSGALSALVLSPLFFGLLLLDRHDRTHH